MSSFIPLGSKLGVDLNNPSSGPLAQSGTTSLGGYTLMDVTWGSQNTEFVYCYVSGALNTGSGVRISQTGTAALWTAASVAAGAEIGFAQTSFTDGQYGWIARRGNPLNVLVSSTSTLTVVLYASDTSGALTTTATSGTLQGIGLQTASTTAAVANNLAVVTWPKATVPGL